MPLYRIDSDTLVTQIMPVSISKEYIILQVLNLRDVKILL